MKRLLVLSLVLAAGSAQAMLGPCEQAAMMADAVIVVQVENPAISSSEEWGYCVLTGLIAQSFRGDTAAGTEITTTVACNSDGRTWPQREAIAASPVVQLHLGADGATTAFGMGMVLLPALTDEMFWPIVYDCGMY